MVKRYQHIHFVGIGGAGMSGIAEILLNLGYRVTGSDARRNDAVERLEQLGAKVFTGHDAAHIEGAHVVVYSSAVPRDNAELQAARQRAMPVIPRAEMLAELMRLKYGDFLVAEADESDGSFLKLDPTLAVVTTIDAEHLDHYGSLEAIQDAFVAFVGKVPFYGAAVLCLDEPNIQRLIPRVEKRDVTYGLASSADLVARRVRLAGM